ncbi:ABC transporter permease [Bifidobacterium sp. DSM 109958]|uniref:ABC transporter permease n=1 Tax=Bifidobacterium moraviense TaxID=2675323 RepID=A0A7Y0I039_9BIFI|nr:TraX family protein [Bifidobacterium sp. DSM 109958]NMN01058.1 ABC transporter permease [Bifidobacterium sp. DSM 109958]
MHRDESNRRDRARGLSSLRLKVIGAVFMALSVASITVLPALLGAPGSDDMGALTAVVLCEAASWCAVPIYAWLLAEGQRRTRNVTAYGLRLFALAAVCEVPYDLTVSGTAFDPRSQNPVWGLLVALIVLTLLDRASRLAGAARWGLAVVAVAAGLAWDVLLGVGVRQRVMFVGAATLLFALIFRWLRARENTMMFTAGLLGAVMCITPAIGVAFLHYRNDELGYSPARPWVRWALYAVYPVLLCAGAAVALLG